MTDRVKPDVIAENITDLNGPFLNKLGVKGLILDIDNTIADYKEIVPSDKLKIWLDSVKASGIKAMIVSNAGQRRSSRFAAELGIRYFARARKPSVNYFLQAMEVMGTTPKDTAVAGDQLFTDILGAKRAGMISILVKPIIMWIEPPQVILKRLLELPLMFFYKKDKKILKTGLGGNRNE